MCNLYSITTNQAAIIALFRVINRDVGNLPPMPGVFPDYPAPVIRNAGADRELTMMRWGMPPPPRTGGFPVTNIRNTTSPHWRGWLMPKADAWCRLTALRNMRQSPTLLLARKTSFGSRLMTIGRCSPLAGSGPSSKVTAARSQSQSPALTWSMAS
jgi:hypothetical protein